MLSVDKMRTIINNGWTRQNRNAVEKRIGKPIFEEIVQHVNCVDLPPNCYKYNCVETILQGNEPDKILKILSSLPACMTKIYGKHKIPRFVYHITTKKNYDEIMNDEFISSKVKNGDPIMKGVFMIELNNFFKRWRYNKAWNKDDKNKKNSNAKFD